MCGRATRERETERGGGGGGGAMHVCDRGVQCMCVLGAHAYTMTM